MPVKEEPTKEIHADNSHRTITIPGMGTFTTAAMPSSDVEKILYYGALGSLAVLEIIEWPVALLIGVGFAFLSKRKKEQD